MADIESTLITEVAANNTAASPDGLPGSSSPLIVYAEGREVLGMAKRWFNRANPTVTSGGSANAQTLTYGVAPASYIRGQPYSFIAGFTNTGAATLNVNGLGTKAIFIDGAALTGSEIVASSVVTVMYDGTQFQIVSARSLRSLTAKNWLINGDMEVWQRGAGGSASFALAAASTAYTADRWYIGTSANQATTIAQQTGLTNGSKYCLRLQRNSGQTGVNVIGFGQPLDSDVVAAIRGSIVTISAKLRSGANWSPASGNITLALFVGTGAVAKRGAGFTSETQVAAVTTALGTSSAVTTATATGAAVVPTNSTQGEVQLSFTPVGTASTNDYVEIDEVMLCIAPGLTAFDRQNAPDEFARCQRFFQKSFSYATAPAQAAGNSNSALTVIPNAASTFGTSHRFIAPMRTTASLTTYNTGSATAGWRDVTAGADRAVTVVGVTDVGFVVTGAAGVAGNVTAIHWSADADI